MTTETDNELQTVRSAQRGSLEAFAQLVATHQQSVRACLAVRLSNRHDAEDLAQETFILAHRKLSEFDPTRPLGPWLRGIALNLLRNHLRKHRPEPCGHLAELELLADHSLEETHQTGGETELIAATQRCLQKLDERSRALLKLRYTEQLPLAELCTRLQRNHSAVTMWLHRLRLTLRECIERQMAESTQ